ncbi:MAG: DUF1993 domain-containing protein [Phyllobacteriaceae bacterium]|jgi:hypothetical protein|nr:DUF1993 domain-containing protein [Phyllobacteriaceae bacterium]
MSATIADAVPDTVKYYLDRMERILRMVAAEQDSDRLLVIQLAPDSFDTGFHFAIAIQFAARVLCPPAGLQVPEIPDELTCESLLNFKDEIGHLVGPITAGDLNNRVSHKAGQARLDQEPGEYVVRFALPNMIFHFAMGYAGLRHGGMEVGKADFDGLHRY